MPNTSRELKSNSCKGEASERPLFIRQQKERKRRKFGEPSGGSACLDNPQNPSRSGGKKRKKIEAGHLSLLAREDWILCFCRSHCATWQPGKRQGKKEGVHELRAEKSYRPHLGQGRVAGTDRTKKELESPRCKEGFFQLAAEALVPMSQVNEGGKRKKFAAAIKEQRWSAYSHGSLLTDEKHFLTWVWGGLMADQRVGPYNIYSGP